MTEHDKTCECELCKAIAAEGYEEAMKHVAAKEEEMLEKYGWYAHHVFDDPDFPSNIHTHGLPETQNHHDLQIVLGLPGELGHGFLINAIELIKKGIELIPGEYYKEICTDKEGKDLLVLIKEATECDRKVLRLIFPDKYGKYEDGELAYQFDGCL